MKVKINFIVSLHIAIFFALPNILSAQNQFSLNDSIRKCNSDSCKVKFLNTFGEIKLIYRISYWDSIVSICNKNIATSNEKYYKKYLASSLSNIGYILQEKGKINSALEYYFRSVKTSDQIKEESVSANTYNSIAYLYDHQGDFNNAISYYKKSLQLYKKLKEHEGEAMLLNNIGFLYKSINKFDTAEIFLNKSYNIYKSNSNDIGQGILLNNLASLSDSKGNKKAAKKYYLESKIIFEKINYTKGLTTLYCNLGRIYLDEDSLNIAKLYADKSYKLSLISGNPSEIIDIAKLLYAYYKKQNDPVNALFYHELYSQNKDSINRKELKSSILKQQVKFEYDKKAYADSLKYSNEKQLFDLKIQKSNTQRYGLMIGVFLISLLAYALYKRYSDSNKKNKLIEEQKKLVDEKQKEIIDSINYAKRIQEAIFADKQIKYNYFPDAFVLFQPKDIVSGDFYWFAYKNNKRIIAVADCTGHGVPGALMSMIGISFLNEIIIQQGITDTAEILSELRYKIINSLKQSSAADSAKDGMDIAIIAIDDENKTLEYSGANNPLWQIKENQLREFKPDKRPIGYFLGKGLPFAKQIIKFEKGDLFYMFSDGFADQFGGPKGKKYKYRQFENLLLKVHSLSMNEQEKILYNEINGWKGEIEQTDDICVIGLRV